MTAELNMNVGEALAANLTWPQSARDFRFGHMDQFFPVHIVRRNGAVRALPQGRALSLSDPTVDAYLLEHNLAALMVLVDGEVCLERYAQSTNASIRWNGFSMTKPITDSLVGVALRKGVIRSLDEQITTYIPELLGTVYEPVTLHQLMTMSSGVFWDENYTSPAADNVRLYSEFETLGECSTIAYMRTLSRVAPPGSVWNYSSGETDLVGVLLHRATGRPLAAQLSESIWEAAGMEHDATWIASSNDPSGLAFGGSGLSATLRDWARLGQWFLEGGKDVLPCDWMAAATRSQMPAGQCPYGYGWWPQRNNAYAAIGIFGQSMLVDPRRQLVTITLGNCAEPISTAHSFARNAFWRLIEAAVDADLPSLMDDKILSSQ